MAGDDNLRFPAPRRKCDSLCLTTNSGACFVRHVRIASAAPPNPPSQRSPGFQRTHPRHQRTPAYSCVIVTDSRQTVPRRRQPGFLTTLASAGLVLAAPTGFRTLPIHPVFAAARKPDGPGQCPALPWAIIPQQCEKSGLGRQAPIGIPQSTRPGTQAVQLHWVNPSMAASRKQPRPQPMTASAEQQPLEAVEIGPLRGMRRRRGLAAAQRVINRNKV
jgi:hypothetical protein